MIPTFKYVPEEEISNRFGRQPFEAKDNSKHWFSTWQRWSHSRKHLFRTNLRINHDKFGIIWKVSISTTSMWENLCCSDARNCGNLYKLAYILKPKVSLTGTPKGKENRRHFLATQTAASFERLCAHLDAKWVGKHRATYIPQNRPAELIIYVSQGKLLNDSVKIITISVSYDPRSSQ